jgi:phospholipid/cholesterol/gamma-HCH transport system permease protein
VPLRFVGTVVGKSVILELGPVLTALVVGGRVSASIAAELGTMKVTEQIDAMEMIAIDPVEYLVLPRAVAATIMLPVLTIFSDLLAILGGMVTANVSIGLSYNMFANGLKLLFQSQDLVGGLLKTFVFGFIIAVMGCYNGFETRGGAEGVGMATMKAVVASCLLILVSNYFLGTFFFRILFAPGA